MRPSSSTSRSRDRLTADLFGFAVVDEAVSDGAFVRAMLDAEAALAHAAADVDAVPGPAAAAIAATCESLDIEIDALAHDSVSSGNPVVPLVRAITDAVGEDAKPWVHYGATSQDIVDTALCLMSRNASDHISERLAVAAEISAALADRYRESLMVARTLGQQAAPSTFGRKAAGWLNAIDDAQARLTRVRDHRLAAQLGGPVGTLAAFGPEAPAVVAAFAARLGLAAPLVPWHTDRQRVLDLAAALGAVVATLGKIALDVELMTQDEVGEVSLAESGGSSSMPHKRNPTSAILITAGFHRTPGLIATLFAAAAPEHERASGGWHSEWQPWRELLSVAGGVAGHGAELLAQLRIDEARMRANLDATGGLLMADRVAAVLAPRVGRSTAHDIVARCVDIAITSGKRFADVVAQDADVTSAVDPAGLAEALDPSGSISSTLAMIDHALVVHRRRPRSEG